MSVLATFMPVTDGGEKVVKVPCIYYSIWFKEEQVRALLNSSNEVNTMNPAFAWKLGLHIRKTNVKA